jgi:hypothetical protein
MVTLLIFIFIWRGILSAKLIYPKLPDARRNVFYSVLYRSLSSDGGLNLSRAVAAGFSVHVFQPVSQVENFLARIRARQRLHKVRAAAESELCE